MLFILFFFGMRFILYRKLVYNEKSTHLRAFSFGAGVHNVSQFNARTKLQMKKNLDTRYCASRLSTGRGDRTRTCGPMVPNHVRYQLRYTSISILLLQNCSFFNKTKETVKNTVAASARQVRTFRLVVFPLLRLAFSALLGSARLCSYQLRYTSIQLFYFIIESFVCQV